MKRLGILAYGSLKCDLGKEIKVTTVSRVRNVMTPFKVEFARSSVNRAGAPTLVPVESGGANVKADILVLKKDVSEKDAIDMLWRRETHQISSGKAYKRLRKPSNNTVLVDRLENFHNIDVVFYTKIGANIEPLTPKRLSRLAIDSVLSQAGAQGLDGISYLINAKCSGIQTPLMSAYEKEILREVGAKSLEDALHILQIELLKKEGKIPKETELLTSPPTPKDAGKLVIFRATIGETYVKLSPPISLVSNHGGEQYLNSYSTVLLDLKTRIDHSYLYVGFKKTAKLNDALTYFNNLMALFNTIFLPFDFVTPSDILIQAKGMGTKIELISSSKAHSRGYGIQPVEITFMTFAKIIAALHYLWGRIQKSKYFKDDNFFQLLGYSQYYLFHDNQLLSFIHAWIFLESCINVLWRELIHDSFVIDNSSRKGTPLEEERNWTTQIKIDELFLKGIIGKDTRKNLQSLRTKRNKVFHRDERLEQRRVTTTDATKAVTTGLKLFYMMLDSKLKEEEIFTFPDIRKKMWEAINRGRLYRGE